MLSIQLYVPTRINSSIDLSPPAWALPNGQSHNAHSLIGRLDQQMSKHVLILSERVISRVRCHVVRCLQGLFSANSCVWFFVEANYPTDSHVFCVFCVCVFRCERLEEQLNDLTELHQNEILNLKQELASMEEKIAYQSYERARDIQVRASGPQAQLL